jgi:hypothetical protein
MQFVGRTGRFVPVTAESGGGFLYRIKDDKHYAVAGTKGYHWMEAEKAKELGKSVEINMAYFDKILDDARNTIENFGDINLFLAN